MGTTTKNYGKQAVSFHSFVTKLLQFHHILVYFIMINLTSIFKCVLANKKVPKLIIAEYKRKNRFIQIKQSKPLEHVLGN